MEHYTDNHSNHKRGIHFDNRLCIHAENQYGAKIYIDAMNRFAIKIEEQSLIFDPAPWVNYQGDRYIDQLGSTYLLTTNPYGVDQLGNLVTNICQTEPIVRNGTRLKTPPGFAPREMDAKLRASNAETSGSRPEPTGSLYDTSGHLANGVPTEPLLSTTVLSEGTPTRNNTRPSHFRKWVSKFDGTGDPRDHLASFRQAARAEDVQDLHVLREGFGLTMEGTALSWFQTLDIGSYRSFETLEKEFIAAFTKTGIKHNVSNLLASFKQNQTETIKDCVTRFKQYIVRCPESEMPSQAKIVSIFLEGLNDKTLRANLYAMKHETINECIQDAIDLSDNCDIYGQLDSRPESSGRNMNETPENNAKRGYTTEEMAEKVMDKMRYVYESQPWKQTSGENYGTRFEQRWTNPEMSANHHGIRHLPVQQTQNQGSAYQQNRIYQGYKRMGVGERNQPQLPNAGILGYGTQFPLNQNSNGSYQMDHKTLMFIANGLDEQKRSMGPRLYNPRTTPGPCYECGGDHLIRDCHNLKTKLKSESEISPLMRGCNDCGIKHLVPDCPLIQTKQGIVTISNAETSPSSNPVTSSDSGEKVPVNAITRAQKAKKDALNGNETDKAPSEETTKSKETWKARRARRAASKKKREQAKAAESKTSKTGISELIEKPTEEIPEKPKERVERPAGSVLAEKMDELDAKLAAYEARLRPNETLEERYRRYPESAVESRQLDISKRLIEAAQALESQVKKAESLVNSLSQETQRIETELESNMGHKEDTILIEPSLQDLGIQDTNKPAIIPNTSIPEVDESWGNKLWEAVNQTREKQNDKMETPPLDEIDFDQHTLAMDLRSEYGDKGSEISQESKADTLKTLPSYLGDYEAKSETKKIPSQKFSSSPGLDVTNLAALMSAPIECKLPLMDVLRIKPELWGEVAKYLKTIGVDMPLIQATKTKLEKSAKRKRNTEPVPLNKVGDYCEGEDGNTTIPVEFNEIKTLAILDSGAGVAIATKEIWESWGRPAIRKTRMKLQLADGHIERPLGLLEGAVVTSCGVEYEHTFAIVDFGKSPKYNIILGRPFMRQLKMIQDWGFNYIYLRQQEAITRININDHSYRDVARTPVEDFESATITASSRPSWVKSTPELWMCGASDAEDENEENSKSDDAYVLDPFPDQKFVPDAWMDILATVDVCVNEVNPVIFCDEEGYDIAPFFMVQAVKEKTIAEPRSTKVQLEQSNGLCMQGFSPKPSIYAIEEKGKQLEAARPCILVEIGARAKTEIALFDTGADLNALSFESWEAVGKPKLIPSTTTIDTFLGDSNPVEGYLDLPIFIGSINVHHRFYVMKPGKLTSAVILGQPWQRTYNGAINWKSEGINFDVDNAKLFTPFIDAEGYSSSSEEEINAEDKGFHKSLRKQVFKTLKNVTTERPKNKTTNKVKQIWKPKTSTTQSDEAPKPMKPKKNKTTAIKELWIPKQLLHVTRHTHQVWVPKAATQEQPRHKAKPRKALKKPQKGNKQRRSQRKHPKKRKASTTWNSQHQTQRWIPKKTLEAQGFHAGATQVWLIKAKRITEQRPTPRAARNYKPRTLKTNTRWVPTKLLEMQGYYHGAEQVSTLR